MDSRKKEAFTLIELLIVVAIIAVLAAIAVPNFLEAQTRAKVARVKSDYRTIAVALESYRIDRNTYINPWFDGRKEAPNPETSYTGFWLVLNGGGGNSGGGWQLTTPIPYISDLPDDPFWISHALKWYKVRLNRCSALYWGVLRANNLTFLSSQYVGVKFFLECCGPDLAQNGFYKNNDPYYDPTNGTTSVGDIWWIQGRGLQGSQAYR